MTTMPPKRGQRRGTRMDAAIAAMHPVGFADKLVRGTVNDLLKVYGGNDGWQFIEENSYLLLIETILEKTKAPQEEEFPLEAAVGDADAHEHPVAGPSLAASIPALANAEAEVSELRNFQASDSTSRADEDSDAESAIYGPYNESNLPEPSPENTVGAEIITRKRRPYHGWISNDEKIDLVQLTTAPLPDNIARLLEKFDRKSDSDSDLSD
ncbi:hypothetical protein RGQ29_019632 [Quercus rubra]|uniref:WIYLD domain-containing protein n=1 Tax=Quercus rubra TaxID=3512 RepID=A0AAN7FB40_QUERU|nr:hypothetical protein RGQ29_019632 [Quercus rubra]